MPLLSYIVLSYNYQHYIGITLQSILDQSMQDFEIVVVDDCSSDGSVDVVRSFNDPRIRLLINESNLGGAASYNRAIQEARGEWLVNLDADDWIHPTKSEIQLRAAVEHPEADIIGSYVSVYDEQGQRHPASASIESFVNRPINLNRVDAWIGSNHLCRSSTMVRAVAHRRIGLDDPNMVRAPDYELWTRAVYAGLGIHVVPQPLTHMRTHTRGVTYADPLGGFLEMSFAMLRNLVPTCDARALHPSFSRIVGWVARHERLSALLPAQRYRLLGMFMQRTPINRYAEFVATLNDTARWPELSDIGRHTLALISPGSGLHQEFHQELSKLRQDVLAFVEARDYWQAQSLAWERHYRQLAELPAADDTPSATPTQTSSTSPMAGRLAFLKRRLRTWLSRAQK